MNTNPFPPTLRMVADEPVSLGPSVSPLAAALADINAAFGYDFRLPMPVETIGHAAEIAGLRGRRDLETNLRVALAETVESPEIMEVVHQ